MKERKGIMAYICQAERMKREAKRTLPRKEKNPMSLVF
jgi:hypothetical protein